MAQMRPDSMDSYTEKDLESGGRRVSSRSMAVSEWHWLRADFAKIVNTERFDMGVTMVILLNMVFVVIEADARAGGSVPAYLQPLAYCFHAAFIVELALRIFVERRSYFKSNLNIMDFCIVLVDFASQLVNDTWGAQPHCELSVLNAFRVCRLLRVIRALSAFRELWMMLHGLVSAFKAMFWACILILVVLLIFSVLGVELIRPHNEELAISGEYDGCDQCVDAFSSVKQSFFTMFLMVFIGDLWSDVAYPIVKRQPLLGFLFMTAFCIVHLGVLNLILTVIVDGAAQARSDDLEEQVQKKKAECSVAREKLLQLCAQMDADGSGELALDELASGYAENAEFASTLHLMDVGVDDLEIVFSILDEDKSGTVTFTEFVDQLHKMKSQESHTLLVFIKHYVNEIREKVSEQLALVRDDLMIKMEDHESRVGELLAIAKDPTTTQSQRTLLMSAATQSHTNLAQPRAAQERSRSFRAALGRLGSRRLNADKAQCVAPLGDDECPSHSNSPRRGHYSPKATKNAVQLNATSVIPDSLPVLLGQGFETV